MGFDLTLPLRVAQLIFNIIVLGCAARVAHVFDALAFVDSPSQINFLIFVSIWTFLALAFLTLTPSFMPRLAHGFVLLAVDALTMLFWFAGFIALAVYISNHWLYYVSGTIKAACAFAAFEWLLWAITTVLLALKVFRGGANSTKQPASAAGGPTVSV
jgi:hypothetical protein